MPQVESGSFLTLHYRLSGLQGQDIVNTFGGQPATLSLGTGELSPALESRLLGLEEGSHTTLDLPAGEAFGDHQPDMLQWVARKLLNQLGDPHERYAAGDRRVIVEWKGWHILLQVCYDLRFPVFSRNRFDVGRPGLPDYDLALYVANWPSARAYPWKTLLRARAIENLCYVVGVNRVGTDGNGLHYSGDSAAIDFLGHALSEATDEEVVSTTTLQAAELAAHRQRFPAMFDGDRFSLS